MSDFFWSDLSVKKQHSGFPVDPPLFTFYMSHLIQIIISMNWTVSDKRDIQYVQSCGSPGPGLKTTDRTVARMFVFNYTNNYLCILI